MVINMLVNLKMEMKMDKVQLNMLMEEFIGANLKRDTDMGKEKWFMLMVIYTMVYGKMGVKPKAKLHLSLIHI